MVTIIVIASFAGGVYYENSRLVGEPDKTIAVMLSKQAIYNSSYQLKINSEYMTLIQSQDFEKLIEHINLNSTLLAEIKTEAESICNKMQCSEEQKTYIVGINEKGE